MSFSWPRVRDKLMRTSSTLLFRRSLAAIQSDQPPLRRFADPAALLDYLHHGDDAAEQKNEVLTALVSAAQLSRTATCAQTLLLLALWPGLDAVRSRLIWRWKIAADDASVDVITFVCEAIAGLKLEKVNRIAATLLRNVERDIGRNILSEAVRAKRHTRCDPDQLSQIAASADTGAAELDLAREVEAVIGRDAELVLSVAFEGLTQSEAGAALGLREAAARKRFQRATRRLQEALQ